LTGLVVSGVPGAARGPRPAATAPPVPPPAWPPAGPWGGAPARSESDQRRRGPAPPWTIDPTDPWGNPTQRSPGAIVRVVGGMGRARGLHHHRRCVRSVDACRRRVRRARSVPRLGPGDEAPAGPSRGPTAPRHQRPGRGCDHPIEGRVTRGRPMPPPARCRCRWSAPHRSDTRWSEPSPGPRPPRSPSPPSPPPPWPHPPAVAVHAAHVAAVGGRITPSVTVGARTSIPIPSPPPSPPPAMRAGRPGWWARPDHALRGCGWGSVLTSPSEGWPSHSLHG